MFIIKYPYCKEEIGIICGEELVNLVQKGETECKCDYCRRIFMIYQGKEKYKSKPI